MPLRPARAARRGVIGAPDPGPWPWSAPPPWCPTVSTDGKIGVRTAGTGDKIDETADPSPQAHRDPVQAVSCSKA